MFTPTGTSLRHIKTLTNNNYTTAQNSWKLWNLVPNGLAVSAVPAISWLYIPIYFLSLTTHGETVGTASIYCELFDNQSITNAITPMENE